MPEGKFYRVVFEYNPQSVDLFAVNDHQAILQARNIVENLGIVTPEIGSYEILVEGEDR